MPGTVIVKPIQAKLDKEERALAKLDPYCVAIIGDRHAESDVCKKGGKTPAWHDALAVRRVDEPYCYLEVKDKSLLKDKMLGICAIDLDELTQQGSVQKWYELYYDKKHAGEILIEASVAADDGYQGGIEGARVMSPERFSNVDIKPYSVYEGATTHYSSAHRESATRSVEPLVGHSPFQKTFDTPITGFETTPSNMAYGGVDRFSDTPIEPSLAKASESHSTMRDILGTMEVREFSGVPSTQYTGNEGNYEATYATYATYPPENEMDREIADLQRKVDDALRKSMIFGEQRQELESHIYMTPIQPVETVQIVQQVHPLQEFQRQDSIPNENPHNEVPLFLDTHATLVHASHDKFLGGSGDDSNAVSKAAEYKAKLLERVERGKNMIKERVNAMANISDQEFGEQSQPSLKHKIIMGVNKAINKRQVAASERKAPRERTFEEQREQSSGKGSHIKQKIFEGVEQIAHTSIRTLSKLEGKMKEKRGIEIERQEEREEVQVGREVNDRHSKSAKKETLKERVEYIKDVSREKVLARLRKPGVDEGVQTSGPGMYVDEEGGELGTLEVIKEKAVHFKDAAVEKLEEMKSNKKKGHKSHKKSKESSSSASEEEEDPRTLGEKVKDGITKGTKKIAVKMAKKKLEKAEENEDEPKKPKKVHKKVIELSGSEPSYSEEEEYSPVHHKKKHHHKKVLVVKEEEQEGVVDKVKGKIADGAKHVAIKVAKKKVEKAEENLEEEPETVKKSHKKTHKKHHARERAVSPDEEEVEVEQTQPSKIGAIKDAIVEGVEKVKEAVMERQVQTEVKKPKKKQTIEIEQREEPGLKQKLKQEVENIRNFAQEKAAQFGTKETETHEYDQRLYNEYERSAEKTFEYEDAGRVRSVSMNDDLMVGMKDLSATLDRLQQRIEARISYQQEYNKSITTTDSHPYETTYQESYTTQSYAVNDEQAPGMVNAIKEKVKEGVEQIKTMAKSKDEPKDEHAPGMVNTIKEKVKGGVEQIKTMAKPKEEPKAEPGTIAGLMDKLSEEVKHSNFDDKIYLTKEYKQSLAEEKELKTVNREVRMKTLKLKVKEGVDQAKNLAHAVTLPAQGQTSVTEFDVEQQHNQGGVGIVQEDVMESINQVKQMTQSQREREVDELFDMYEDQDVDQDLMIQLQDSTQKPGMVETIKHKVAEGVEQIKTMAHMNQETTEIHHQTEAPSGPIANLMDDLSEEISKPNEASISETQPHSGMIDTIKHKVAGGIEQIKTMAHMNQGTTEIHHQNEAPSGPIADLMDHLSEEINKPKEASIFETQQHPGMVDTVKQKVREGVEQVKELTLKSNEEKMYSGIGVSLLTGGAASASLETPTSTGSTIYKYDYVNEEPAARIEQPSTGVVGSIKQKVMAGFGKVKEMMQHHEVQELPIEEDEVAAVEVFCPHKEVPRTPPQESLNQGAPFDFGYDQGEKLVEEMTSSDVFHPHQEIKRSPEESMAVEQGKLAESVYVGDMSTSQVFEGPSGYVDYGVETRPSDLLGGFVSFGGAPQTGTIGYVLEENREIERPIENTIYESQYVKKRDVNIGGQSESIKEVNNFEQQGVEDKENRNEENFFDKAFTDFTYSSNNQRNW